MWSRVWRDLACMWQVADRSWWPSTCDDLHNCDECFRDVILSSIWICWTSQCRLCQSKFFIFKCMCTNEFIDFFSSFFYLQHACSLFNNIFQPWFFIWTLNRLTNTIILSSVVFPKGCCSPLLCVCVCLFVYKIHVPQHVCIHTIINHCLSWFCCNMLSWSEFRSQRFAAPSAIFLPLIK